MSTIPTAVALNELLHAHATHGVVEGLSQSAMAKHLGVEHTMVRAYLTVWADAGHIEIRRRKATRHGEVPNVYVLSCCRGPRGVAS